MAKLFRQIYNNKGKHQNNSKDINNWIAMSAESDDQMFRESLHTGMEYKSKSSPENM